jgi:hypothetical protein
MSRARKPKAAAEVMAWAEATNRWDAWQQVRDASQAGRGGIAALVPGISAAEPPADFEPLEGFVSPRVARELGRYS